MPVLCDDKLIEKTMANCREITEEKGATRISLRALARKGLEVRNEEARIPLNSNVDVIYVGANKNYRSNSRSVVEEEKRILTDLLSNTKLSSDPMERVSDYKVELLREFNERDLTDIKKLFEIAYERDGRIVMWYEPTKENISQVLKNSVVAVARNDEKIVSLTAAEKATIPTSIGDLDCYEMSDAATLKDIRRLGLLQACTYTTLNYIFSNHPDLVYSEARACNIGATKALLRIGFNYGGFLPKHVKIGGSRDVDGIQDDIEDLNVLYKEVNE